MSKEIIKLTKQHEKLLKACDLVTELSDLLYKLDEAPKECLKKETLNKKGKCYVIKLGKIIKQ